MAHLLPLKGYYPSPENAGNIAIESFDNYSEKEISNIIKNNNQSFINIIFKLKELTLKAFYIQVRERFIHFVNNKWLIQSKHPSYYIYQKTTNNTSHTGIIGLSDIDDLKNKTIKLHEQTFPKRENILTQYLKEVKLNSEPVALIYEKRKTLSSFLQKYINDNMPLINFKDSSTHTLWEITEQSDIQFIQNEIDKIDYLLVADGHHRIMSSLKNFEKNNDEPYFLSILFDHENVSIEPYTKGGKKYTFEEIKSITSKNELLPPKSTWILPKLKTGLIIYDLKK